jgi:YcaO-like protein with predicted kinase domain
MKRYRRGTHRACEPAETLARLKPLLPRMGITRLANVTGLDRIGIPVVMAVRPNSRSISVSQGKGLDLDAAKASAAMEAAESFHAETIEQPLRLASYDELSRKEQVVDVSRLPLSLHRPFHSTTPMLWVEGEDWMNGGRLWAPHCLVHMRYTNTMAWDLGGFRANSTGLASGNHLLEAVSHALCEAIERDCSAALHALAATEREARRIDLDSVADGQCRYALDLLAGAGILVAAWDMTNHAGIAAVCCEIQEASDAPLRRLQVFGGYGCHPSPEVALLRAVTEAVQSRLTMISGARDDMFRADYVVAEDSEQRALRRDYMARRGVVPFSALPRFESDSFGEDVAFEIDCLRLAGCEHVVVVDLSKPEFDFAVARVIVPGMHDESHRQRVGRSPEELL